MALSDMAVRQAKAVGKAYTLGDLDGLSLAVSPQGGRTWHFRYCWAGKQKRMSLGTYPEVGLRDARTLRDQARGLLAKGINPKVDRKLKRQAVCLANGHTFKAVFLQWYEHRKLELKEGRNSTRSQIKRIFGKELSLKNSSPPLQAGFPAIRGHEFRRGSPPHRDGFRIRWQIQAKK